MVVVVFGFVWMADCANAQVKNPYPAVRNADGSFTVQRSNGEKIIIRDPRAPVAQAGPALLLPKADALKAHRAAVEQARRMRGQVQAGSQHKVVSPPKPPPIRTPVARPAQKPAETRPVPAPASAGSGEIIRYVDLGVAQEDKIFKFQRSGKEFHIRKGERTYAVTRFNQQYQPISDELLNHIPPGAQSVQ